MLVLDGIISAYLMGLVVRYYSIPSLLAFLLLLFLVVMKSELEVLVDLVVYPSKTFLSLFFHIWSLSFFDSTTFDTEL